MLPLRLTHIPTELAEATSFRSRGRRSSPGHQRPLPAHAGLQMPPICRSVLPRPRRTAQLPPPALPPSSARSRRPPQTAPPPEDRDSAGHLASRLIPIDFISAQARLAGASPNRTLGHPVTLVFCTATQPPLGCCPCPPRPLAGKAILAGTDHRTLPETHHRSSARVCTPRYVFSLTTAGTLIGLRVLVPDPTIIGEISSNVTRLACL